MTFKEFQGTRKYVTDLSDPALCLNYADPGGKCGFVYHGNLVIEDAASWPERVATGHWYLILGKKDWVTDDLEELEKRLYRFAVSSGLATSSEYRLVIEVIGGDSILMGQALEECVSLIDHQYGLVGRSSLLVRKDKNTWVSA